MNGYFSALLRSSGVAVAPMLAAGEPRPIVPPPVATEPFTIDAGPAPPERHDAPLGRTVMPPPTRSVLPNLPVAPTPDTEHWPAAPASGAHDTRAPMALAVAAADTIVPAARTEQPARREPPPRDEPESVPREPRAVPTAEALLRVARRWVAADPALVVPAQAVVPPTQAMPIGPAAVPLLSHPPFAEPFAAPSLAAIPTPPPRGPDPPAPRVAAPARDDAPLAPLPRTEHQIAAPSAGAVEVSIGAIHVTVDAPLPPVNLQAPSRAAAPAPTPITPRGALARRSLRRI